MAAALSPQLSSKSISTDPEGPRVLKNQVSWAEKEPCSPTSTTRGLRWPWLERLHSVVDTDPGPKYDSKLPSPAFLKILQVLVSAVTAGLYSEGIKALNECVPLTTTMAPYFVTSNYLIVTPIVLLSYVLGHRMPEILVRIFNSLAVVLFVTAGALLMRQWQYISNSHNGTMLFATGLCCFLNSMLYAADIAWSWYSTLARRTQ